MNGAAVDLARLARAVHLNLEPLPGGRWKVFGGQEPHVVDLRLRPPCDCVDAALRDGPCTHVLAARLRQGDVEVLGALRQLVVVPKPRRLRVRA